MNSPIFVQPSNVITVGPIGDVEPGTVADSKPKQVAAIIRPVPRDSGDEGSLRMDPAQSKVGKTHLRSHQLEDYVNWLLDKIEADTNQSQAKSETTALDSPTCDNPPATEDHAIDQEPPESTPSQTSQPPATNATIETESPRRLSPADHEVQVVLAESGPYSSTISTDTKPAEVISDSTNLTDSVVERSPSSTRQQAQGFSTKNIQRVDDAHSSEVVLPAAHLSFTEVSQTEPVSAEDAESFISTVSKAIASVLTKKSEPDFEQKIRTHFESELHATVLETMVSRSSTGPVENRPAETTESTSKPAPTPKMKLEAEKIAAGILNESRKEIPSYVAAWDVEDFRWPSVTNRMIVAGGDAIGQLSKSILETITPENQRVAITGLGRGEGTSSIAISLARWSAACGKKVLLVDADIASPTLGTDIGLAPNLSWVNAVSQSLPAAEVIVRSQKTNLCVMPMAKMVSRVTWPRFIFDNLGELINNVRNHFDLVILDLGPASQLLAELSRPEHLIDSTLLVHDGIVSSEFSTTKARLESFGLKKFMVAQNRAPKTKANVA